MVIDQAPEFNHHVDNSIPLTWEVRRRIWLPLLPLLLVSSLLMVELVIFQAWLAERSFRQILPLIALGAATPVLLALGAAELEMRLRHRSRRTLKFDQKGVVLNPARIRLIRWKFVRALRFEPIPRNPPLCRLTVEYAFDRKRRRRRGWSLIVPDVEQVKQVRLQFEELRQRHALPVEIVEGAEPTTKPQTRQGMLRLALAIWLLVHGLALLPVGISDSSRDGRQEASSSKYTPEQREKFRRVVLRHFSSAEQFRRFCLISGTTTAGVGLIFYISGLRAMTRPARDANH